MKKHSLIVEIVTFLILFTGFALPPLILNNQNAASDVFTIWNFPLQQLIYAFTTLVVYVVFYEKKKTWLKVFPVLVTVGALFCFSFLLKAVSLQFFNGDYSGVQVCLPENLKDWIFCILTFLFAAVYEEMLYRFYLADALISITQRFCQWKILPWIIELLVCALFAFAHLYLGVLSVINAALAHVALRICYKKGGSIWFGVIAHFIYNVISLILL